MNFEIIILNSLPFSLLQDPGYSKYYIVNGSIGSVGTVVG